MDVIHPDVTTGQGVPDINDYICSKLRQTMISGVENMTDRESPSNLNCNLFKLIQK